MELLPRFDNALDEEPPTVRSRMQNHATLLVSWWCTGCALVLILLRLWGRAIRTEKLFKEDKIMALSIIPLLIRMALVDPILLYGTNNTNAVGLDPLALHQRMTGAKLVLASRIFYAMFIWMSKFTVSEYLKRLTCNIWTKQYEIVLQCIRVFLGVTFVAVVIATLSECQPFDHYWQVIPDPGPSCRSGYAQLFVMSICDIITDILIIAFPIPIILRSAMPMKRKITITILFSMSTLLIVITCYRLSIIVHHHGRQQTRSLWASLEILASAAVSNALILGSFVRDRGVKKAKYKGPETGTGRSASEANTEMAAPSLARKMTARHWGNDSDEDLFRHCRGRLGSIAEHSPEVTPAPMVARPALPSQSGFGPYSPASTTFAERARRGSDATAFSQGIGEIGDSPTLFDVGGILEEEPKSGLSKPPSSHDGSVVPLNPGKQRAAPTSAPSPTATMANTRTFDFADAGGLLGGKKYKPQEEQQTAGGAEEESEKRAGKRRKPNFDFALSFSPASRKKSNNDLRNASGASNPTDLQDIGGLLSSPTSPAVEPQHESQGLAIADAGGLLSPPLPDDRKSRGTSPSASPDPSTRKARSRSNSLLRTSLRNRTRSSSHSNSQNPSRAPSHRKTRSRSRGVDPATAALGTVTSETNLPSRDVSRPPSDILEERPSPPAESSQAAASGQRPVTPPSAKDDLPADPETPPEHIDTKAHARDWLAKIKSARERQNENHGITTTQARARGGEGSQDAGMSLSDIGGLLDTSRSRQV